MHKHSISLNFLNEQDEHSVKINCLSFEKPNYQELKQTPFWDMSHCLDVLSHIKAASQVYRFIELIRNEFIKKNATDEQGTNMTKNFVLPSFGKKEWIGPLEKMKKNLHRKEIENDRSTYPEYMYPAPIFPTPVKSSHSWYNPDKETTRLREKFNNEYPEISPAFEYLVKCLGDIRDLFKIKDFIDVKNEFEMDKCQPFKFLRWAEEAGYAIPLELEIFEDECRKIKWLDPITHGNIEQTFPKHPTGKDLKDDPLYVAVKVREAFMRGDIPESGRYRTNKQRLQKYVDDKYKNIISQSKRNDIVSLVNDGAGHGGSRKK